MECKCSILDKSIYSITLWNQYWTAWYSSANVIQLVQVATCIVRRSFTANMSLIGISPAIGLKATPVNAGRRLSALCASTLTCHYLRDISLELPTWLTHTSDLRLSSTTFVLWLASCFQQKGLCNMISQNNTAWSLQNLSWSSLNCAVRDQKSVTWITAPSR